MELTRDMSTTIMGKYDAGLCGTSQKSQIENVYAVKRPPKCVKTFDELEKLVMNKCSEITDLVITSSSLEYAWRM